MVSCDMWFGCVSMFFPHSSLLFFWKEYMFHLMFAFSRTVVLGDGWVIVVDDMNIVIRQDHDTFFDEVAQGERRFGPHYHHEGGKTCAVTGRQFSDPRSWYERPL